LKFLDWYPVFHLSYFEFCVANQCYSKSVIRISFPVIRNPYLIFRFPTFVFGNSYFVEFWQLYAFPWILRAFLVIKTGEKVVVCLGKLFQSMVVVVQYFAKSPYS
jgi:hypothetical protein